MKSIISNKSKNLIKMISENFIEPIKANKQTRQILLTLYMDLLEAYKYALFVKNKPGYYSIHTKKIQSMRDISKPRKFNYMSFPKEVINTIDNFSVTEILYSFSLYERNFKIYFISEDKHDKPSTLKYNKYIFNITMWLYILNKYSSKTCSPSLTIYIYLTHLEKKLPSNHIDFVLDEINVNTAFTTTCPLKSDISEIIIFRKEEWFKVLIHETFHNFGLDFSDMNNTHVTNCILNIFKVKSDVNLYECYTEFWAEIINSLFFAFLLLNNPIMGNETNEFISLAYYFLNLERKYSFLQTVKILRFMQLPNGYTDLYSDKKESIYWREMNYKENTNVLSYYIIKTVLFNKFSNFLQWCNINNQNILQFKKTFNNQIKFCKYIDENYKTTLLINNIKKTQLFLNSLNKNNFLLTNLRMTVCEID